MTGLAFRNVLSSPDEPVEQWTTEALEAALSRGSVQHWARIAAVIRRDPWGPVARTVESVLGYTRPYGTDLLMERAITAARLAADQADRAQVAVEVRAALAASGLTRTEAAARLGTSPSRLSTYATGRVTPSAAFMVALGRLRRGAVDHAEPQR